LIFFFVSDFLEFLQQVKPTGIFEFLQVYWHL